jgi:uncharacterized protein
VRLDELARRIFLKDDRLRPIIRCIIYIVATGVCAEGLAAVVGLVAVLAGVKPADLTNDSAYAALFISEACLCAAAVGVAVAARRFLDRRSVASLGFTFRGPWARLLLVGFLLGAGMQAVIFAIDAALGYSRVTALASAGTDLIEFGKYVPLLILVAVAEEMLARGYLFQNLWEEWGVVAAAIVTSALFAVSHLGNPNSHAQLVLTVVGLLAYAVWACLSVVWTKSLWLVVGVHFAWNLFEGPVFGFPVSGLAFGTTAVAQSIGGPEWFTGGSFGPEAGASALAALAAGLAILYWMYRAGTFSDSPDVSEPYARKPMEREA